MVQDYEGVAWYALRTMVAVREAGQICRLCFQAANYRTEVWINGHVVGNHEGGYTPFYFEVQKYLKFDAENIFIIRIISPIITKDIRIDSLGPNEMPHWRGGLTAGIWQALSLEFNQYAWIESAFYQPQLNPPAFDLVHNQTRTAIYQLRLLYVMPVVVQSVTMNLHIQLYQVRTTIKSICQLPILSCGTAKIRTFIGLKCPFIIRIIA